MNLNLSPDEAAVRLEIRYRGLVQNRVSSVSGDAARMEALGDSQPTCFTS